MRNFILVFFLILLITSCNSKKEEKSTAKMTNELVMAPRSEMAILMNEMYAYNESIKQQIISGELYNSYPEHFDKIYSAVLTEPADRDQFFETSSNEFISKTKLMFNGSGEELVTRYNDAVNSCVSCHQEKCVGPIPRIKKLLIKE